MFYILLYIIVFRISAVILLFVFSSSASHSKFVKHVVGFVSERWLIIEVCLRSYSRLRKSNNVSSVSCDLTASQAELSHQILNLQFVNDRK